MKKVAYLLVISFCFLPAIVSAQELTLYGEGFIPTGRYAKSLIVQNSSGEYYPMCAITDSENWLGGAGGGWGVGLEYAQNIGRKNIDMVVDFGFRMGWTNSDVRQYFEDYAKNNRAIGIAKAPMYYNFPLLLGPRWTFDLSKSLDMFFALEFGGNLRLISDAVYTEKQFADYYTAATFGFRVAAGVLLFDHLRLEANWSWLGDDPVEATIYGYYDPSDGHTKTLSGLYGNMETMQFSLRAGWTF